MWIVKLPQVCLRLNWIVFYVWLLIFKFHTKCKTGFIWFLVTFSYFLFSALDDIRVELVLWCTWFSCGLMLSRGVLQLRCWGVVQAQEMFANLSCTHFTISSNAAEDTSRTTVTVTLSVTVTTTTVSPTQQIHAPLWHIL